MREIICPSGLVGRIRPLEMKEGRLLTDAHLEDRGVLMESLVDACWVETVDPGPYKFTDRPDWGVVLQGDRFYALVQVAEETYGKGYGFNVRCVSCRKRIDWEANLDELAVYDLDDETRKKIKTGDNSFPATTKSGQAVTFRLLTGADEQKIARWVNSSKRDILEKQFRLQLVSVEGVELAALDDWVSVMTLDDHDHLREQFAEVDCGIETEIEIRCPHMNCLATQEIELPFGIEILLRTAGGRRGGKKRKRRARTKRSR